MSTKNWFILSEGQVIGPFTPEEVESKLGSLKTPQVWGKGQGEWLEPAKWRNALREMPAPKKLDTTHFWRIRIEGKEQKPLTHEELLKLLKTFRDLSHIDVFIEPSGPWREIYAVQELVDDLGISRRSHPRVPISGTLECELSEEAKTSFRVVTISEGGLGLTETQGLQIGQQFKSVLNSTNLYMPVQCTCEVVYVGQDGYAGLRFVDLTEEAKSSIIEYVKKFATV